MTKIDHTRPIHRKANKQTEHWFDRYCGPPKEHKTQSQRHQEVLAARARIKDGQSIINAARKLATKNSRKKKAFYKKLVQQQNKTLT